MAYRYYILDNNLDIDVSKCKEGFNNILFLVIIEIDANY